MVQVDSMLQRTVASTAKPRTPHADVQTRPSDPRGVAEASECDWHVVPDTCIQSRRNSVSRCQGSQFRSSMPAQGWVKVFLGTTRPRPAADIHGLEGQHGPAALAESMEPVGETIARRQRSARNWQHAVDVALVGRTCALSAVNSSKHPKRKTASSHWASLRTYVHGSILQSVALHPQGMTFLSETHVNKLSSASHVR
jgi:hypothetical protein